MELMIVTGMSGAGKTMALQTLEDIGYYCVDNLPLQLLLYMLSYEIESGTVREKTAVTIDIRSESLLTNLDGIRQGLEEKGYHIQVLFLDATDEQLRLRYKETRRLHPLILKGQALDLGEALAMEREHLMPLRQEADVVLDTTHFQGNMLRTRLLSIFSPDEAVRMSIEFVAFGFKYGILADADLVFDVRCLPNPYYEETLRNLTGNDAPVRDFVLGTPEGKELFDRIRDFLEFTIPLYIKEGKPRLVVGFGCTGGQHRSLVFAGMLKEYFEKKYKGVQLICRDTEENRFELLRRQKP